MSAFHQERVLSVRHWTDRLFSFRTTRAPAFRFRSGQFVMMGLERDGRPLLRAYSLASAHYEDELEFFSIKVPDGPLTSRLQHLKEGDEVLIGRKPTGTLIVDNLKPGRTLFLLGTGTGLAPFLSIVRDPEAYDKFERIVVAHGVRWIKDLAYSDYLVERPAERRARRRPRPREDDLLPDGDPRALPQPGPPLARADDRHADADARPAADRPAHDRFMLCGSPAMLADLRAILDARGFEEGNHGEPGDYVIEKAFVDK